MECPSLSRRVSTRAGVFSAVHRHLPTSNASCLPSSSRPTTPIVISPEVLCTGAKPISDPRLSSLMTSALHSSPSSSLCPALSSAQIANVGDGQFSDAGSEEEEAANNPHRKKRVKLTSSHSAQDNLSLPTKCNTPAAASSRGFTSSNVADAFEDQDTSDVEVVGGGPSVPYNTTSASLGKGLRSTRPTKSNTTTVAKQTSLTHDRKAQLPMATRRLAMLAGIPESSQAIIQSTLFPPSRRPNLSKSPSYAASTTPRAGTNSQATTSLPTSDSLNCSLVSSSAPNESASRYPKPPSSTSAACSSPRDSSNRGNTATLRHVPARRSASTCHADPALTAMTTGIGSQQAPHVPLSESICDAREVNRDGSTELPAPRYGRPSDCAGAFTMPAPGSFSIRAPPSTQLLRAYDPSLCPEASELASRPGSQLESFEESSELDTSSQPPSTCPPHSPSASSSHTVMASVLPSRAPGNRGKRKAGQSQATSQTSGSDNGRSELGFVKPPPTINGKVSHSRKVPSGYIKRTPNSFLMFRSHVIANKLLPPGVEGDNRQISRVVSGLWAGLSEEDLQSWQTASRELKAASRAMNPGMKHAPNQKRKEVVRRRRNGQLPGETPEQRVEREKATAVALAKVIIDTRGEKLGRDAMAQSPASVQRSTPKAQTIPLRDSTRETNRTEFRAPVYYGGQASTPRSEYPRSEYAESTLTTSPAGEARRSLSAIEESPVRPRTSLPGMSSARYLLPPERSHMVNQAAQQSIGLPQSTIRQDFVSPVSASTQSANNQTEPPFNQPGNESYSGLFSNVGTGLDASASFTETFSNEMLRSLGLTASDLNLTQPASSSLPQTTTGAMNDSIFQGKSFAMREGVQDQSSSIWSQETGYNNLVNSSSTEYPFRDTTGSQQNSQTTAPGIAQSSYPSSSQLSQADTSQPLEFSALIDDSSFTDPLKSDVFNFDSMYLNYQSNPISNKALEEACQSLTTNRSESALGSTTGEPTPNQGCSKSFWSNL
ncbi:hypothetical protein PTTG_07302 [Puccinia triticina 1-1 BBBD Race 1]|uniref:HMG box domain-containing protein n=2 Tax=Puccinia triticina TaxID=208348 RepID=A0A180H034_PUCT1|nr:uncharacterized protein PtA15_15A369 [Puccinia triticina]OAV97852.1 hypothetical protein PTTG_07302 [Puccinia triticina 1-1 BBBD Race 1]WAQ91976.1 hypothetical protein PtA15_15A369 [Puccinia triticina]WAR62780.1 hypothetical protein PtB15_15B368 [Puccinia triticina]